MKKVFRQKVLIFSIALAIVAFSIAYYPVDGGKETQKVAEANTFSLIPPSFVKNSQNRDILW